MEADERTALLGNEHAIPPTETLCPPLRPVVDHLLQTGSRPAGFSTSQLPPTLAGKVFEVLALLMSIQEIAEPSRTPLCLEDCEAYEAQQQRRRELPVGGPAWMDRTTGEASDDTLEDLLWTPVAELTPSGRHVRIVDFLAYSKTVSIVESDKRCKHYSRIIWTRGQGRRSVSGTVGENLINRLDGLPTPRVLHLMDLCGNLVYLLVLLDYLLDPPHWPVIGDNYIHKFGLRGVFLTVYALASVLSGRSMRIWPFAIVLTAFVVCLPGAPVVSTASFSSLLLAFLLHVLCMHVPVPPTPIFLFAPDAVLPLATLLWHSVTHAWLPVLGFFLPALFLATNLLSVSLSDVFLQLSSGVAGAGAAVGVTAPLETRAAFLALYLVIGLLYISSTATLVLAFSSTLLHTKEAVRWDRYGAVVGREARALFAQAGLKYSPAASGAYPFPAPLNLLPLFLVDIPLALPRLLGHDVRTVRNRIERVIWRVTVAPLAAVIGALWIWWDRRG